METINPQHLELHHHQVKCFEKICSHLEHSDRALIKMFCGTGKSRIQYNILSNYKSSAIIVPSIALGTQFMKDYILEFGGYLLCFKR